MPLGSYVTAGALNARSGKVAVRVVAWHPPHSSPTRPGTGSLGRIVYGVKFACPQASRVEDCGEAGARYVHLGNDPFFHESNLR
jgi:hypothetical protein